MKISKHIRVVQTGLNSVVLSKNGKAWIILTPALNLTAMIKALRGAAVERVICLNHRASLHDGLYHWVRQGATLAAPRAQESLFSHPEQVADAGPFHHYSFHPAPDTLPSPVKPDLLLDENSVLDFEGIRLSFSEMKGDTPSELLCLIEDGKQRIAVCGDVLCEDGRIPFLHRMTKAGVVGVSEYHSFLLAKDDFIHSLQIVKTAHVLVPARGSVFNNRDGDGDVAATIVRNVTRRLAALYDNYASVNALRHYFPETFPAGSLSGVMAKKTARLPSCVMPGVVSYLLVSKNKRGILLDCGNAQTLELIERLLKEKRLVALDACFITHYHDDHVDHVNELRRKTGCRVWTTASQADVLKNPWRYRLPALSHESVDAEVLPNEQPFEWDGMKLTAFDLPGQSVHHGALFVENKGKRILFCGDSFAPTGLDDYCAGNRNFLSGNRGYFACLKLLKKYRPDWILNPHIPTPFHFSDHDIATLHKRLTRRKALLKALTPWHDIDLAADPAWVRLIPVIANDKLHVEVQVTSHCATATELIVKIVAAAHSLPAFDGRECTAATIKFKLHGYTCGYLTTDTASDLSATITLAIPPSFKHNRLTLTAHAWLDDTYLGTVATAPLQCAMHP